MTDGINRFASATASWVVRMLLGVLVLPAGAVLFVGLPLAIVELQIGLLEDGGGGVVKGSLDPGLVVVLLLISTLVFMRACWAHRRATGRWRGWKPWLLVGAVMVAGAGVTMALEHTPRTTLHPHIHGFFVFAVMAWLMPTTAWLAGRITSRLFRRLERRPVTETR